MTHDPRVCPWTAADETHLLTWPDPGPDADADAALMGGWLDDDWDSTRRLRAPAAGTRVVGIPAPRSSRENPAARHRRRREPAARRVEWSRLRYLRWVSLLLAALATALVAMLSVLGGLVSYDPLRDAAASATSPALTSCWPLLIYGPWLVASLSILRAALYQRHTKHSWSVVMVFSGFAVVLCVSQAPMTVTGVAVAGIPPISALAAFQQIVRQMTLGGPARHAHPGAHKRSARP
ncbi:DUF2637 domain-containing protein [Streptomyces sp. URMC 129]|uniref:DUF2637 domain-containing protein n=1 Tax=Streptomyces sp. URMC 129 TaxID=3423407 RepID=UPI003F19974F